MTFSRKKKARKGLWGGGGEIGWRTEVRGTWMGPHSQGQKSRKKRENWEEPYKGKTGPTEKVTLSLRTMIVSGEIHENDVEERLINAHKTKKEGTTGRKSHVREKRNVTESFKGVCVSGRTSWTLDSKKKSAREGSEQKGGVIPQKKKEGN